MRLRYSSARNEFDLETPDGSMMHWSAQDILGSEPLPPAVAGIPLVAAQHALDQPGAWHEVEPITEVTVMLRGARGMRSGHLVAVKFDWAARSVTALDALDFLKLVACGPFSFQDTDGEKLTYVPERGETVCASTYIAMLKFSWVN